MLILSLGLDFTIIVMLESFKSTLCMSSKSRDTIPGHFKNLPSSRFLDNYDIFIGCYERSPGFRNFLIKFKEFSNVFIVVEIEQYKKCF